MVLTSNKLTLQLKGVAYDFKCGRGELQLDLGKVFFPPRKWSSSWSWPLFFCWQNNLLGGQFWPMARFNLLKGQNNLPCGQMTIPLTCFLPLWLTKTPMALSYDIWYSRPTHVHIRISCIDCCLAEILSSIYVTAFINVMTTYWK